MLSEMLDPSKELPQSAVSGTEGILRLPGHAAKIMAMAMQVR
jgi:hypothetical protein